jgi:hypothetical protein
MAHYLAYATQAGTSRPREMLSQVHQMLTLGLWGVPTTALLKTRLLPGDGLIVAVGAPYRGFVGDAVIASRYRKFSEAETSALPPGLAFDHGLTLNRAQIWPHAAPIEAVWRQTTKAKNNKHASFRAAIHTLPSVDAALIIAAGTGRQTGIGERTTHATDGSLAEAEDDKIIALMNARRAAIAKPPLSADQEKSVRESRRAQRTTP